VPTDDAPAARAAARASGRRAGCSLGGACQRTTRRLLAWRRVPTDDAPAVRVAARANGPTRPLLPRRRAAPDRRGLCSRGGAGHRTDAASPAPRRRRRENAIARRRATYWNCSPFDASRRTSPKPHESTCVRSTLTGHSSTMDRSSDQPGSNRRPSAPTPKPQRSPAAAVDPALLSEKGYLELVWRRDVEYVRRTLRLLGGSSEASIDDLVQRTFIVVRGRLPGRDRQESKESMRNWLCGICVPRRLFVDPPALEGDRDRRRRRDRDLRGSDHPAGTSFAPRWGRRAPSEKIDRRSDDLVGEKTPPTRTLLGEGQEAAQEPAVRPTRRRDRGRAATQAAPPERRRSGWPTPSLRGDPVALPCCAAPTNYFFDPMSRTPS
jgi:hypothetical protein